MWATASAPTGYLLCTGTAVSRTTYAALFAVIGTTFGAGDGSTTFNLPNYSGVMPIGANVTYALGSTGGSATTTLTTSNLPSHSHTITDNGHSHSPAMNISSIGLSYVGTGTNNFSGGGSSNFGIGGTPFPTATATTGITSTNSTGSGTAATTISPYLGINFIIKT